MMKGAGAVLLAIGLGVGCGGDDDGGDAGGGADAAATGGADARERADAAQASCQATPQVNGTVADVMVDPVASSWSRQHPTFPYAHLVMFDEDVASTCDQPDSNVGQRFMFIFCDPPVVGEYEIVPLDDFPGDSCPGELVASALLEDAGGSDLDSGQSGTVTIDAVDGCVTGSFDVTLETGTFDGSIAAVACE